MNNEKGEKMKRIKGLLVVLLSLSLTCAAPAFTALAETDNYSAFYNGYRYDCYGHLGYTSLTVEMNYLNTTKILSIDSDISYVYGGTSYSFNYYVSQKSHISHGNPPGQIDYLVSMTSDFQISMNTVYSMLLYAN